MPENQDDVASFNEMADELALIAEREQNSIEGMVLFVNSLAHPSKAQCDAIRHVVRNAKVISDLAKVMRDMAPHEAEIRMITSRSPLVGPEEYHAEAEADLEETVTAPPARYITAGIRIWTIQSGMRFMERAKATTEQFMQTLRGSSVPGRAGIRATTIAR